MLTTLRVPAYMFFVQKLFLHALCIYTDVGRLVDVSSPFKADYRHNTT